MKHLIELLKPETTFFDFTAVDKKDVIAKLLDFAIQNGKIEEESRQEIFKALEDREKSMSTGIGSGVAIPHCSTHLVQEIQCFLAVSPQGIPFDAIDDLPVQIFILLLVPKSKFQEHIKTLALIAKTLNQKEERDKLIACRSFEDILACIPSD